MRLLICTLYFPPCSLTPANRTFSWAKYLHQFGIYPVIITRQWPREFSPELYEEKSFGKEVIIEKHADYEVHYLPFTGNFRTRSLQKAGTNKQKIPRRIFLLFELLLRNSFQSLLPYSKIFKYVLNYVAENKTDKILISGSPFQLFKIGYLVKMKYNIPWIADYRDGWTGGNHNHTISLLGKIENISNKYYEKKWIQSADCFITVSPFLKTILEKITRIKGFEIYNGFYHEDCVVNNRIEDKSTISFLYSGAMYPSQDYQSLVAVFKKLINTFQNKIDIKIYFLGTVYKHENFKNDPVFKGFEKYFILLDRVNYQEGLKVQEASDVFLMLAYKGIKGITTSKIFDYIKFRKPIILYPNDFDIVEEILTKSGLGVIAENEEILQKKLTALIICKAEEGFIGLSDVDENYIKSFSRKNQARLLANIIKNKS